LLNASTFRNLVSGNRRGLWASLLRTSLRVVEIPYTAVVRWRNARYDSRPEMIQRVPIPVISVGNLTLGGTGKTPLVQWIAVWLQEAGLRVAILSRGYKAVAGQPNDEALELAANLPGVPHLQNPQRIVAARQAIAQFQAECLVLDDAFQHRRLHRDLDIVLLDALEPLGFEHVFPRGTLREPVDGLRRAGVIVLSRADLLPPEARAAIRNRVQPFAPQAVWAEVRHAPRQLLAADGSVACFDQLRSQPVAAFCGIGNPAGFRHTLEGCGFTVAAWREFPDHHAYSSADLIEIAQWADRLDVAAVVCTQKDLVKIRVAAIGKHPLWALQIGLEFIAGQEAVESLLRKTIGR
jgi:tetraacyldisaccharide 4'-kinase